MRAGRGTDCLRHGSWQWVARRFDVEAARPPVRPGLRDCFQRQGRWRDFERSSRRSFFLPPRRRNRSTGTISRARPSTVSRLKTRRRRSPPSPRPASRVCCRCCRRAPRWRLFAAAARATKPCCGNWRTGCRARSFWRKPFGWSSDAMEAQAFAYLAARRLEDLPIPFR